jgi:hypothetical protein
MTRGAAAIVAVAALLGACGGSRVGDASLERRIEATGVEIRTRIGAAACRDDGDCRALPLGALACGGPSRFVAYSVRDTDEGALARLSAEHQALSARRLAAGAPQAGICVALAPPVPRCEASACRP